MSQAKTKISLKNKTNYIAISRNKKSFGENITEPNEE